MLAGDRVLGRLRRIRGVRRGVPRPYRFENIALTAPFNDDYLGRELAAFTATSLGSGWREATKACAGWLIAHSELIVNPMFRDVPLTKLADLLPPKPRAPETDAASDTPFTPRGR